MLAILEPTSTLISFRPLALDEITETDIKELRKAIESGPIGQVEVCGEQAKQDLIHGRAEMWRLESEHGNVIFLLQEIVDRGEKSLFVSYMAGKGLTVHGSFVDQVITEYGRTRGCRYIRSLSLPVIARYLKRFGYEPVMFNMRKEI